MQKAQNMKKNKSMSAKQKLVFEASNFTDTKSKFYRHVESHYFNFAVGEILYLKFITNLFLNDNVRD